MNRGEREAYAGFRKGSLRITELSFVVPNDTDFHGCNPCESVESVAI